MDRYELEGRISKAVARSAGPPNHEYAWTMRQKNRYQFEQFVMDFQNTFTVTEPL